VLNNLGDAAKVLQAAFWGNNAEVEIASATFQPALYLRVEELHVFWMIAAAARLKPWRHGAIDLEDAIELVRPTVPVLLEVRGEAAGLAEALPPGELRKGFAQFPFARLEGRVAFSAVDRDTRDFCEPVDEIFFLRGRSNMPGPINRHDAGHPA
jgi:hypothetical protein